jgi:RraA family protein
MTNVGFRIYSRIARPDPNLVSQFVGIPVANIADNMNRMSCIANRIRPFNDAPLLGCAFTVKARPGDNLLMHKAIDMAQPGDVLVIDGQGDMSNAMTGELMVMWMIQRHLSGLIVDGAIRDCASIRRMSLPVYAAGVTPKGPYKEGPGEINVPVCCDGVVVKPGDILVGDADGVVVIDPADAPDVLAKAKAVVAKEAGIVDDIRNNQWERSWVDKALAQKGCEYID